MTRKEKTYVQQLEQALSLASEVIETMALEQSLVCAYAMDNLDRAQELEFEMEELSEWPWVHERSGLPRNARP